MGSSKILWLDDIAPTQVETYGVRSSMLARLAKAGMPVPEGVVVPIDLVAQIASGEIPALPDDLFKHGLLSVRSSAPNQDWGGPSAMLNIGANDALVEMAKPDDKRSAMSIYRRFIHAYSVFVKGVDPEEFENIFHNTLKRANVKNEEELSDADIAAMLEAYKTLYTQDVDEAFPQCVQEQLEGVLKTFVRTWNSPTAKILRLAKGAPEDAGLALIIQRMALGIGKGVSGTGLVQFVDEKSGAPNVCGYYLSQSQGQTGLSSPEPTLNVNDEDAAGSNETRKYLDNLPSEILANLSKFNTDLSYVLGDAHQLEFTVENGNLSILDARLAKRSTRASVRIIVDLVETNAITKKEALLRIDPSHLTEYLHPQIAENAPRQIFGNGLPASPGAAAGKIVFSAEAAMTSEARDEACILVRTETSPEDIRGMRAATGVLTVRGGMTSHAAVIARGLGLPCVVGASNLRLDFKNKIITTHDGQVFNEGDKITVDGSSGQALIGAAEMVPPDLGDAFNTLMQWADELRTLGIRANADTPADARMAQSFMADGIGLCRTEHMFFEADRITIMREMILAESNEARAAALSRLLPMQRNDFIELFEIMRGLPVTIRLLDPPLHEFLPHSRLDMQDMAEAMGIPVSQVIERAKELSEFNPMLGKRGVRLGLTMPEIYEMQARAIFEATAAFNKENSEQVVPEIMIPLVSAHREVELVKQYIDKVAQSVMDQSTGPINYKLGVMVETPRAALRSGDLAESSEFLSFGTNDLTQMTYGLSRDDSGRFMNDYVNQDIYSEDPFHTLDLEGVGELMVLAANRGRERNPDLELGLCGEHGGDPASIRFCKSIGFDYISCSPFRVPIARLAAAQASILRESVN